MKTIVPGILLKQKKNLPARRRKKPTNVIYLKRHRLESYLKEGYSRNKAMELAGYSEKTIRNAANSIMKNVNWDEVRLALKSRSIHANHMAIDVAMRQMEHGDAKQQGYGAKLALDNAKIHLAEDKTPTNITFNFQTIKGENVQVNVGDKEEEKD